MVYHSFFLEVNTLSQQDNKPINLEEQINWMKKYVNFRQNKKMREYLKRVGYFRASRYGKYLLSHTMQLGRKPDHNLLFNLYRLDMELRKLFFEYCQYIEIQTRTYISDFISLELNNELFYLDVNSYTPSKSEKSKIKKQKNQHYFPTMFKELLEREGEIRKNQKKYPELAEYRKGGIRMNQKLPCWVYFSYADFGNICLMYSYLNMKYKKIVLDKGYIGRAHSKTDVEQYVTWLDAIKNLRNICCHHNILIGRTSSIVLEDRIDNGLLLSNSDLFSRVYALNKLLHDKERTEFKVALSKILLRSKVDWELLEILPSDWESKYDKIHKL